MQDIEWGDSASSVGLRLVIAGILVVATASLAIFELSADPQRTKPIAVLHQGSSPQNLKAELGKLLFNDTTLSNPPGQSCASCHAAEAGFTFPNSRINEIYGVAPGVVPGRFVNRAVPTITYAVYIQTGTPVYDPDLAAYVGGLFWDGRATDLANQATFPFQNPNEMNDLVHNVFDPELLATKVARSREAYLFAKVYGPRIFYRSATVIFNDLAEAIGEFEKTPEVSPFTSKYDAYIAGRAKFTPEELDGLRLVTGSWTGRPGGPPYHKAAECVLCHGIPDDPSTGPDLWTNTCYANVGVPKNPNNPFYKQTNQKTDPVGYNPQGANYIDLGLGDFLYPHMGLPPGNMGPGSNGQGDFLAINGAFKAPTLRNVDKRPYSGFVKPFFHNGVFKDLKTVVHFYNARNLTTVPGEVIDFTQPDPYANLQGTPLFPPPEYPSPDTLQNPQGAPGSPDAQVGNLGLTDEEENHIVSFLKTLSDGYEKSRY
jgi:cytochrome c peroxidase